MRLTDNFSRWEFACRCGCGFNTVDYELVTKLQEIRSRIAYPVTVTSGSRCVAHNTAVDGKPRSYHLVSKAADIQAPPMDPTALWNLIDGMFPLRYGLERYRTFVHFDVRTGMYRSFDWS
jgi:uncharacterized protein YcbK (DUF882 family)